MKKTKLFIMVALFLAIIIACDRTDKNSNGTKDPDTTTVLTNKNDFTLQQGLSIILSLLDTENKIDSLSINCENCKAKFVKSTELGKYVNMDLQKIDRKIIQKILETDEQKILIIEGIKYAKQEKSITYAFLPFPKDVQSKLGDKNGIILGNGSDECDYFSSYGSFGTNEACLCFWLSKTCNPNFCGVCGFNGNLDTNIDLFNFDFFIEKFDLINLEELNPLLNKPIKDIRINEIK
ncbi:hypothetical protein [Kordia sp.]|uniref:hypothetical protein n=1 Tax=Kordia sp. TaxID=1965332 RepID=UPI003D2D3D36